MRGEGKRGKEGRVKAKGTRNYVNKGRLGGLWEPRGKEGREEGRKRGERSLDEGKKGEKGDLERK